MNATRTFPVVFEDESTLHAIAGISWQRPQAVASKIRIWRRPNNFFMATIPKLTPMKPMQVFIMLNWKDFSILAAAKKYV